MVERADLKLNCDIDRGNNTDNTDNTDDNTDNTDNTGDNTDASGLLLIGEKTRLR